MLRMEHNNFIVNPIGKGRILFYPYINYLSNIITATPSRRSSSTISIRQSCSKESVQELRSSDLVALEYANLKLKHHTIQEMGVGHVRIRQHVNPLSSAFQVPAQVPDWGETFCDSSLPLMVDIGCGSGRFLIWHAKGSPETKNFMGLEIRQKLVNRAQLWVKELDLNNICFLYANATVSFEQLVSNYPGPLGFVSILCPDPHFKKRHHKRRVVQTSLVNSILKNLSPGGQIYLHSDVLEVALDMRSQFDAHLDILQHIDTVDPSVFCDEHGWLLKNPMGIRTEREIHAELEGATMYRRMYQKRDS
ncbi:tRNA (guanine-N(7)-)-methyltransferase [Thalictrum thalictroides]|uniref:tRNA (guanine(46)-N(7))-methyltransferase n=1 Tax=Thalictrum thalictroides TaxID=46969 RepID=A0A7J6XDD1_THATH|nr:tRNA (guanine-N(7)-)-methyltransferase [Thalictrum thalictroides]